MRGGRRCILVTCILYLTMLSLYFYPGPGEILVDVEDLVYCDPLNRNPDDLYIGSGFVDNQNSADPDPEQVQEFEIAKNSDGVYNVINGTTYYDIMCIRSDLARGTIFKTNDTLLWNLTRLSNATVSVTRSNQIQPWFHASHVGNFGDNSQKLPFVSIETNNQLFGNDSFDLTGNHNQLVDIRKQVATERGFKYIMLNATKLESTSDAAFKITVAPEPFIKTVFWRLWVILFFSSYLVLSYLVPKGYIIRSRGLRVDIELAKKTGLLSTVTWMLEIFDMYKDWVLLFAFQHARWAVHGLIFSIVIPFALTDLNESERGNTVAHTLLIHLGLTEDGLTDDGYDKKARVFTVFFIAAFENIPQLIIVVCEFFYLKQSVTFVQAGNPIFGLFMTYKAMGLEVGQQVKDFGPFSLEAIIWYIIVILPQVFVCRQLWKHMVSYDDIPQIYYEEGLITREDPDKVLVAENQEVPICAAISILSIALCYFQIYSFNRR